MDDNTYHIRELLRKAVQAQVDLGLGEMIVSPKTQVFDVEVNRMLMWRLTG